MALDGFPDCVPECLLHQVMLDSPVSPGWDLSVEMASYVRKLQHVSANCRLSVDEELTLLSHCVCDPSDRRFNEVCAPHCSSRALGQSQTLWGLNARARERARETERQRVLGGVRKADRCISVLTTAVVLTTAPAPLHRRSIPSIHSAHHGARSSSQALHSVHSVLLCKNRRSALRARQAGSLSCAVELPPRPDENRWIYAWSSQVRNGLLMAF